MADNRSANQEYALGVDEMILEYLLYNTIKVHLRDLRSRGKAGHGGYNQGIGTTTQLVQIFDQYLELFKHNHPDYDFSPETDFSIMLLQFLALFTQRHSPKWLSQSSRDKLKQSSTQYSAIRLGWWDARHPPERQQSSQEDDIVNSWRGFFTLPTGGTENETTAASLRNLHAQASTFIPLLELLPGFLHLSAEMAANLGQDVTKQWMVLAAEFMLQSAWEKLVYLDAEGTKEPLKAAFGWGHWENVRELEDAWAASDASMEVKTGDMCVGRMFSNRDKSGEFVMVQEWSKVKLEYLSAFGTSPDGIQERPQHAQRWQVKHLREIKDRFPIEMFDGKITDYLEGLWKLGEKPLLVQIEQGKIEGWTKEEFKELMGNVFPKGSGGIDDAARWWTR
jgi:hypothetical protein